MAERDHLIFYDRDCGFCRRMLRIVLRRDARRTKRLAPIALQDSRSPAELPGMSETERMASWHLKSPSGEVVSGGAAFSPLIELLGLPLWVASVLSKHPALSDRSYRWVADHRVALGRLTRRLPDLDESER